MANTRNLTFRGRGFKCVRWWCIDDIKVRVRAKMPTMSEFICVQFSINYAVDRRRSVPVFVILQSAFFDTRKNKKQTEKMWAEKSPTDCVSEATNNGERQRLNWREKRIDCVAIARRPEIYSTISRIIWNGKWFGLNILSYIFTKYAIVVQWRSSHSLVRTAFYTFIHVNGRTQQSHWIYPFRFLTTCTHIEFRHLHYDYVFIRMHHYTPATLGNYLFFLSLKKKINIKIAKMQREIAKYHGIIRKHFHFLGPIASWQQFRHPRERLNAKVFRAK